MIACTRFTSLRNILKVEKIGLSNDLDTECEKKETKNNSFCGGC